MKLKNFLSKTAMFALIAAVFCSLSLVSCNKDTPTNSNTGTGTSTGGDTGGGTGTGGGTETVDISDMGIKIEGKITHDVRNLSDKATITFNRFPKNVAEFKKVQELIGGEPHGSLVLQLMAFEMYRRDVALGTECISINSPTLNGNKTNVITTTGRLKEIFGKDANYARPYLVAAYIKGASPTNGYNPDHPYVITITPAKGVDYTYSGDYRAKCLYLDVLCYGIIDGATGDVKPSLRQAEIVKPKGENYFYVNNCPGLYTQVAKLDPGTTFNGLK